MASELTPQQIITQLVQATADDIASALTARMASISLPVYDWESKMLTSSSMFCHTLENWLLLNCILPDSDDHLRYIFAALEPIPGNACTMDANGQMKRTESDQGNASAFLIESSRK